jgi:transcriptional regulator with XRE-family HTH domain
MDGTDFKEFKNELLQNPNIKQRYQALKPKYVVIAALIARRNELKVSQRELARRTGLKQPAICRLESGIGDVTLDTLLKVTEALNMEISLQDKEPESEIIPV